MKVKGTRPRRKVIIVLVDGPSDRIALSSTISAYYDSVDPNFEVFFPPLINQEAEQWGDITSMKGIYPKVIEGCINKLYFDPFLEKEKLYPKDISEVIHIFDMDGAYLDDSSVVYGDNPNGTDKPYYGDGLILTKNVESITERNKRKRENLDYLFSIEEIIVSNKHKPYSMYFFSSNLDHFLHNDANIAEGREKYNRAGEFAMKYESDPDELVKAIENTPGALLSMNYEESWEFIRERGPNSVGRFSNIHILFQRIREEEE